MFINDIFNDNNKKLDEVSNELLGRYKKAAGADASAADKRGDVEQGNKRFKGIVNATKKELDNDVKRHKKLPVKENDLTVPKGWQATTQPDGSTRISKQGSMSSADYKQNMADYKAKNWTPEKMADYSQRMASGQGYTDAERSANYQQQQQHFGQYADKPLDEAEPTTNQPRTTMSDERKAQLRKDIDAVDYNKEQQPPAATSPERKADIRKAVKAQEVKEQGVAEGLPQTLRKVVPGYAKREIDKKMDAEKFGRTDVDRDANYWRYKKIQDKIKNKDMAEGSAQDKLYKRHQEIRKKAGRPDPEYYQELKKTYDMPDDERWARTAELKKKYKVSEARKSEVNFDIEDIKKLERIRDLPTLKAQAMALISKPSERPMKPEKVAWFDAALDRMDSPMKIIKLMYDLLLSGEGHQVIGSKRSMNPNSYRDRFGESSDGSVKYEFTLADGKKDYQTTRPAKYGDKAPVDPNGAAITYKIANPLKKIKSVKVVDKPDEEKSQIKNEDVERYVEELERAGYEILEEKTRLDPNCWKGYRKAGTKMKGGVRVNNCVPVKKKVDEYGAANGPPNLNKSDIKRMMPPEPVAEQIPTITDTGPREQPHPAAQTLDLVRGLKRLAGIDKYDVENAVNQEITNVVRSPQDASSKNVSIINRLFGPRQ